MCGSAYEAGGLLWAARANVLSSLNQVLGDHWDNGFVAPRAGICAQKLAWIEIELGCVAYAVSWMELADLLASAAKLTDKALETFTEPGGIRMPSWASCFCGPSKKIFVIYSTFLTFWRGWGSIFQ
jgi:hypothetical protein